MKKYLLISSFISTALIWSCGKADPDPQPVTPEAPSTISLSREILEFPQAGGAFSITVTSPSRPSLSGVPAWITFKDGVYKDYKLTYDLTASVNEGMDERSATITVSAGSLSRTLTVKQAAYVRPSLDIDANLTNSSASQNTVNVYNFLRENAGLRVLSGIQSGDTANNNDRSEAIYSLTGKHPALVSYDFIFLQYSPTPDSWSWKVDYGDISAAREQWQKNGLVSYMWHWNVPTSEQAWEKGKSGDFEGYGFYCDKTDFDILLALTPGTWENDFLLQDIEKVAGYLKLLQDEGIPVLWRPLHEAAGNYHVYGTNGAWFWWGRGGADACKRLWKLLRDKLEGEYSLDNLIWVWTLDVTQGAESEYASWYPGNDLVDIVGVDIYENDTEAKSRQYSAAVELSGGHKLVTISECGNIPDPAKFFAAGEAWSWFLPWNMDSSEYTYNTDSYWKQLMSSSLVYSRESMPSLK